MREILWISIWTAGSRGGCRTDSRETECGVVDTGGPMPGEKNVSRGEEKYDTPDCSDGMM